MSRRRPRYHRITEEIPSKPRWMARRRVHGAAKKLNKGKSFDCTSSYLQDYDVKVLFNYSFESGAQHESLYTFAVNQLQNYKIVRDLVSERWRHNRVVKYIKMSEDDFALISLCYSDLIRKVIKKRESR